MVNRETRARHTGLVHPRVCGLFAGRQPSAMQEGRHGCTGWRSNLCHQTHGRHHATCALFNPAEKFIATMLESEGYKLEPAKRASATGYLGVYLTTQRRYNAKLTINEKQFDLGTYDTAVEAAVAVAKRKAMLAAYKDNTPITNHFPIVHP